MSDDIMFPNQATRVQITAGLRQLADYLDTHPTVPVAPYGWDLLVSTHDGTDDEGIAKVDRIAAILGVSVEDEIADGGHYTVIKAFGPITYQAFHIPARHKAGYRAARANPVTPDADAGHPPQAA